MLIQLVLYSLESSSQMKHSFTEEALLSAVTLKHSTFLWLELHLRTKKVCKHQPGIQTTGTKHRGVTVFFFTLATGEGTDVVKRNV